MITFPEGEEVAYWLIVNSVDEKTKQPITRKVKTFFIKDGKKIWVQFGFNKPLLTEIKAMAGAKWWGFEDPPQKKWTIEDNARNRFQLEFLAGMNPYARYELPLLDYNSERPLYVHQKDMTRPILTHHNVIIVGEMGVGKSLSIIEAMEQANIKTCWWIAPKGALNSTRLELSKWKSKLYPELYTYEGMKKVLENWKDGDPPPQMVVFDEMSRVKNPTAQRSQAAYALAEAIRSYWGDNGYIVGASGSPAPKNPGDWWFLCEIVCPGFIREGTHQKFIYRLAVTQKNESAGGGFYSSVLAWKDNEKRCDKCGQMQEHYDHNLAQMVDNPHVHPFVPTINEVSFLYERMKGLVHVWFKKDCLDLPDKIYRLINLKPAIGTLNAAKIIAAQSPGAAQKLVRLRELSDGFQYKETKTGTTVCKACAGTKKIEGEDCVSCSATGELDTFERTWDELSTPKEEALIDLLDEHEEMGRMVVYAAFTASIDRVVNICRKYKWEVIRVDGRGWQWIGETPKDELEMLKTFQREGGHDADRVVFVGHPGSAGMGLTLTASPSIVYFSNDFNAENRIQSEDRIHRIGMDVNRGATIIDLIHLPTDKLVLENLKKKRDLQALTMGELQRCLEGVDGN